MNIINKKFYSCICLLLLANLAFSDDVSYECNQMSIYSDSTSKELKLISAAAMGNLQELNKLILAGVSPNTKDDELMSALAWASYCGKLKAVEYLVEKGADVNMSFSFTKNMRYVNKNSTALIWAVSGEKKDVIAYLLKKGANINCREKIYQINEDGKEVFYQDGRNAMDVAKDIQAIKKDSTFVNLLK